MTFWQAVVYELHDPWVVVLSAGLVCLAALTIRATLRKDVAHALSGAGGLLFGLWNLASIVLVDLVNATVPPTAQAMAPWQHVQDTVDSVGLPVLLAFLLLQVPLIYQQSPSGKPCYLPMGYWKEYKWRYGFR